MAVSDACQAAELDVSEPVAGDEAGNPQLSFFFEGKRYWITVSPE